MTSKLLSFVTIKFEGTPGLWELITSKNPQEPIDKEDYKNYESLILKTNALDRGYDPDIFHPRANKSKKLKNILSYILAKMKEYEGKGGRRYSERS